MLPCINKLKAWFNINHNHETIKKEDITQEVFDLYTTMPTIGVSMKLFMDKIILTYALEGCTVASLLSFIFSGLREKKSRYSQMTPIKIGIYRYNSPKGGGSIKGLLSRRCKMQGKTTWG